MVQRRSCFCIVQISSENVHTAKSNLQIQGESHQAFDVIICRSREEIWNQERPRLAKTILKRNNPAGSIPAPDFQLHSRTMLNTQRPLCLAT